MSAVVSALTKPFKHTNVTQLLIQLRWFPVNFGFHFNILVWIFRALYGQPQHTPVHLQPQQVLCPQKTTSVCITHMLLIFCSQALCVIYVKRYGTKKMFVYFYLLYLLNQTNIDLQTLGNQNMHFLF